MAVIGTDLAWFPACDCHVAVSDLSEYFLNVPFWIKNPLINYIES